MAPTLPVKDMVNKLFTLYNIIKDLLYEFINDPSV